MIRYLKELVVADVYSPCRGDVATCQLFFFALDVGASGALFFILGDLGQLLDTLDGFALALVI